MVSISILGSSSDGNSAVIATENAAVLVDAGLSKRKTFERMAAAGLRSTRLSAALLTHEHIDHVAGIGAITRELKIPVFLTEGTRSEVKWSESFLPNFEIFEPGAGFQVGDIEIVSFAIPHDALEPVGYVLYAEGIIIAIATDLGHLPVGVRAHLRGADVILVEANHNIEMLRVGPYPPKIKQRIASDIGHLSNDETAEFIEQDMDGRTSTLILGHLSKENNHPEIVNQVARRALKGRQVNLVVVDPSNPEPLTFTY